MSRVIGLILLLALVAACGGPLLQDDVAPSSTFAPVASTTVVTEPTTTTTPVVTSTTSGPTTTTAPETTTSTAPDGARPGLEELGLTPGEPIESSEMLPPPEIVERDMFRASPPYQLPERARVSSRIVNADGSVALTPDPLFGSEVTITRYDGYVIFDRAGSRMVSVSDELWGLATDGSWDTIEMYEWPPFGPIPEWATAQIIAQDVLDADPVILGQEMITGVDTLRIRHPECGPEYWCDLWLDGYGTAMRIVVDRGWPDSPNQSWLVWDVFTLDPQDVGPLPPD